MYRWTHRLSERLPLLLMLPQRLRARPHPFSSQLNTLAQPAFLGPADGVAATSSRLPKQKRVTQQIIPRWLPHVQANQAPPDALCQNLRDLHLTQVVEAVPDAEAGDPRHSILGASMSAGDKSRKLCSTPAAWLSCLSTSDGVMAFTAHAHHVNTCIHCNKTRAHKLIQDCLVSIVRDAGFSATTRVPAIEVQDQHIRADIYIPQMQVDGCRGLCIDVSRVWQRG